MGGAAGACAAARGGLGPESGPRARDHPPAPTTHRGKPPWGTGWLADRLQASPEKEPSGSREGTGRRSWGPELTLPGINPGDMKANAAAGVAAVSGVSGTQDVLYKLDISGEEPALLQRFDIGLGDDCRCSGIGFYGAQGGHRFDFHSVAILPDGRLAVSFMDSTTIAAFPTAGLPIVAPAMAVELPQE